MTATGVGAIAGVPIIGAICLLISITVTVINEYISKLKERYLRLRTFANIVKIDYEKVFKKSLADKFIDEKERDINILLIIQPSAPLLTELPKYDEII